MSGFRFYEVICDFMDDQGRECGETADALESRLAVTREHARNDGWRVALPGGRDLCPKHRDEPVPTHRAGT